MRFAFAISGVLASSSSVEDDAVMLSVAAIRDSIQLAAEENQASTNNALNEMSKSQDPRRASELLQEFALNTVESGQGVDADTRQKLIDIRDILTNETYVALEQAHRHDQDLLTKHARAINDCGAKHIRHLQQDIEGQEVQLVRMTEDAMYKCRGLPKHSTELLQDDEPKVERYFGNWSGILDPKYDDPDFVNCYEANEQMFDRCDALDNFVRSIKAPQRRICQLNVLDTTFDAPTCETEIKGTDTDLDEWFSNMKAHATEYEAEWKLKKKACDDARKYYKDLCLDECARKQRQFETAFCSFRQGLHATCREYQGCHVLNKQQFEDLVKSVMYNADSRKIDWKAIHKIECYINVLISTETNEVRAKDLLNCEAGNLNTIEGILTGFNETNYLSLIVPEINVSCWEIDIPQYIDFKECDMTSVQQHPCTEEWLNRYNGLVAPADCTECAPIPDEFQYHMEQESDAYIWDAYGGGWYFVNEAGFSNTDINDLNQLTAGGYHLPKYDTRKLRWNEILIQRVSSNWCDSWGSQTSYWAEAGGASMCVQSDDEYVYCMNNAHNNHSWRRQPANHFTVNCDENGVEKPECVCWPKSKHSVCWAYGADDASGPTLDNVEAPSHVRLLSLKSDGSVVKISFQGEEKNGTLKIGNYNAFMQDAEGCRAIGPVSFRVFVRCLGCSTDDTEFHTKDGAQFNGAMTMNLKDKASRSEYTYEAWFKSPLEGKLRREIFGGSSSGLTLVNEKDTPCLHDVGKGIVNGGKKESGYQLHAGFTTKFSSICFDPNTFYHVAVTKDRDGVVKVYVNGADVTAEGERNIAASSLEDSDESTLTNSFGAGFTDGGQLFNVRIWDFARTQVDLSQDAFKTRKDEIADTFGLAHWWPLTDDLRDIMTGIPLQGPEVRYAPVWCADLEKSGMFGC